MHDAVRRLRSQAKRFTRGRAPTGIRYSAEFRAKAVTIACKLQDQGVPVPGIARDLGLRPRTVARWLRRPRRSRLRPVRVVAEPKVVPAIKPEIRPVLFTSSGLRIEGLDIDAVVQVLRFLA